MVKRPPMVHLQQTQFILIPALHKLNSKQLQNLCVKLKMRRCGVIILTNSPARTDKACRKIGALLQLVGQGTQIIPLRSLTRPVLPQRAPYAIYTDQKQQRHLIVDGIWIGHSPISRIRTGLFVRALSTVCSPAMRSIISNFRSILPVRTLLRGLQKSEAFFSQELESQMIEYAINTKARHVIWTGYSNNKEKVILTPHYKITFTGIKNRNRPRCALAFTHERWHVLEMF